MTVIITSKKFQEKKVRLDSVDESENTSPDPSSRFEVDSYLPIINQILSSMKTRIEVATVFKENFRFRWNWTPCPTAKLKQVRKRLLQYYPNELEESLSEEMIYFSTLIKQHHFNSECKEIQMSRFINENKFMHAFPNVSIVFRLYLCLMIFDCSGERSFSVLKRVKNQLRSSMG